MGGRGLKDIRSFILKKGTLRKGQEEMKYSNDDKAYDAYSIINELMGELHAARTIFHLTQEKIVPFPKKITANPVWASTLVFMRRICLLAFGSVLFKYLEAYEDFLKPIGCETTESKSLYKKIRAGRLDDLRQLGEHLVDKNTKRSFTPQKIKEIFASLKKEFPDLFGGDSSKLIGLLERCKDEVIKKYPKSEESVKDRHRQLESADTF